MDIIIIGCGKIGYTLAKHLSEEDNNVVVIDKKIDSFNKIIESIDVMVVNGNGLSGRVLIEAGVKTADLVISVTSGDETNILCCLTAKKLGAKHTIARVRDPEYAMELYEFRKDLGLDMIINPEQQAAREISRLLRFPSADDIDTFADGIVELVAFRVTPDDFFVGHTVSSLVGKNKSEVVFAMIQRQNTAIIPHGDFVLLEDDIIRVLGRASQITEFFKSIRKNMVKIKDALIIGGGKITYYLAQSLERHHIDSKIIEIDEEKCNLLSNLLNKSLIILGDGTDEDLLYSENIKEVGAVVCLTDRDEENIVIGLHSMHLEVPKVIVKVNHINLSLTRNLGLGSVVCPKNITAYQIIRYVRGLSNAIGSNIKTMYKIYDTEESVVEALEFTVTKGKCLNVPLKHLKLREGVLIGCIVRRGTIIAPTGNTELRVNDNIIVIAKDENIAELDDILAPDEPIVGGKS